MPNENSLVKYICLEPLRSNGKSQLRSKNLVERIEEYSERLRTQIIRDSTKHYMPRILKAIRKQFDAGLATKSNFKAVGTTYLSLERNYVTFSIMGLELFTDKAIDLRFSDRETHVNLTHHVPKIWTDTVFEHFSLKRAKHESN